jgi:hypothetical protein
MDLARPRDYTLFQMWAAHACVFFAYEYAHSFTAWLLGGKTNPLALYWARPTIAVLLIQMGINQNVDEGVIFASGYGPHAAIIAAVLPPLRAPRVWIQLHDPAVAVVGVRVTDEDAGGVAGTWAIVGLGARVTRGRDLTLVRDGCRS